MELELESYGDWELLKCLGSGSFGVVHYFKNRKSGLEIATKCFKLSNVKSDEIAKMTERWRQEHEWQQNMKEDCFVGAVKIKDSKFLDYLQQQHQKCNQKNLPVIIMEYCNGGDLRMFLNRMEYKNGLPECEVRSVLRSLRNAIEYLHKNCHIEHRDIKPENIVIQIKANAKPERVYKLADFGYIRPIPDMTIAQSVVGTAHYVAPEVIQSGLYNSSVDYWSMGIVAFELICGIRPFIPHHKWCTILEAIITKPPECIAIVEHFRENVKSPIFHFVEHIFPENNCTKAFVKKIEKWLERAVDLNYKNRGRLRNELIFYTEMDAILQTKIVVVFSLYTREYFSYTVDDETNMEDFLQQLRDDTKIQKLHLILPLLHPKKTIKNIKKAVDFYVNDWCDRSEESFNPLAMLYVTDIMDTKDYAVPPPFSSDSMNVCMQVCAEKSNFPKWLINDFVLKLNYHLNEEQRKLSAYMQGLQCFAVTLEHEIILFRPYIHQLHENLLLMKGRWQQFNDTICFMENNSLNMQYFSDLKTSTVNKYRSDEYFVRYEENFNTLRNRLEGLQRESTREAKRDIYHSLVQEDIYKLKSFRLNILQHHENFTSVLQCKECLEECQKYVDNWLKQRRLFYKNSTLKEISNNLKKIFKLYENIQQDVWNYQKSLNLFKDDIKHLTKTICCDTKRYRLIKTLPTNGVRRIPIPLSPFNTNFIIKDALEVETSLLASMKIHPSIQEEDVNKS